MAELQAVNRCCTSGHLDKTTQGGTGKSRRRWSLPRAVFAPSSHRSSCIMYYKRDDAPGGRNAMSQDRTTLLDGMAQRRTRPSNVRGRNGLARIHASYVSALFILVLGAFSCTGQRRDRADAVVAKALVEEALEEVHQRQHTLGVIVPHVDAPSSFTNVPWKDVLEHMNTRLGWEDPDLSIDVYDPTSLHQLGTRPLDGVMVLGVHDSDIAHRILDVTTVFDSFVAVNSSSVLQRENRIKGSKLMSNYPGIVENVLGYFLKDRKERIAANKVIEELFNRVSSDDFFYSFLVYFNVAVRPIASVQNSTKRSDAGLKELGCMLSKCPREIFNCVNDPTCKTALDCLDSCSFNDQVCSYRCIASYESPELQEFSLCILQKHNCLGLDASIPEKPSPVPMKSFRGETMTHSLAQELFTGWLDDANSSIELPGREKYSWRVFAGKNAAYDKFPCQYQLFFPGKARNSFWYRPVFKVETLDGKSVWRERLYRVKQHKPDMRNDGAPVFRLSVLDNGVTSLEDWTILDCDENLLWCIFSYSGAASRAGLSYSGAILASRDGLWPTEKDALDRIEASLDVNGIKMWELTNVDNSKCGDFVSTLESLKID